MPETQPESKDTLEGFWTVLEFRLSGELYQTNIPELKGFWCDGIHLHSTDHQLKKKFINDNRKIHLTAYLGKTGQEVYDATIHFGKKAQSIYARDLPLINSIPSEESNDHWFEIDVKEKLITIFLN